MPIDVEALLQPISDEQPAGVDLRYQPITDQIKEARRQDDDIEQGVWKRELKLADYPLVIKLSKEALAKRSKDLQIAGWLTEALLNVEGFAGLRQGLDLIQRMLETYWEGLYPQIDEDGDLELRATPLRWVASQLDVPIRSVRLTKAGHNWYQYRQSRTTPTEDEARSDAAKQEKRTEAVNDGATLPEDFEKGLESTPAEFLQGVYDGLGTLVEFVRSMGSYCDDKFGDAAPDFGPLRATLEDVHQTSRILLLKRGGGQAAQPEEEQPQADEEAAPAEFDYGEPETPRPAAPKPRRTGNLSPEPVDADDAIARLLTVARYLRRELPMSPAPYLIPRALRWGELRSAGAFPDAMFLAAPASETRMELKRLTMDSAWEQLREAAEEAAGQPAGRAWLDLQRFSVTACRLTGADVPAQAIVSELKALIADIPQLPQWVLADDTPTANAETQQWLKDEGILPAPPAETAAAPDFQEWMRPPEPAVSEDSSGEPVPPDAYDLAMEAARGGRIEEALDILSREITHERSGRGRFLRRVQLAQVCVSTGHDDVARPILEELAEEIDHRGLEAWESADVIVPPLALLYRSLGSADDIAEVKRKLYGRICRLDPGRALSLSR